MSENILYETACFIEYIGLEERAYAPKWYYSKEVKEDDYSKKIFYSKKEDKSWYFKQYISDLIQALKKEHLVSFNDVDLITIIPSHKPGKYSITLEALGQYLSTLLNSNYEKVLIRIKNTRPDGKRHKDASERYKHVKDTLKTSREIKENKILILDDVKTTGIDILESKKTLVDNGVTDTITICLGINTSVDRDDTKTMITYDEEGRRWEMQN